MMWKICCCPRPCNLVDLCDLTKTYKYGSPNQFPRVSLLLMLNQSANLKHRMRYSRPLATYTTSSEGCCVGEEYDRGGWALCQHGILRSHCRAREGGSLCQHRIRRSHCRACEGGSLCQHRIRKSFPLSSHTSCACNAPSPSRWRSCPGCHGARPSLTLSPRCAPRP